MKNYSKYSKYLVAVDCIVFGYDIQKKILKLLLVKRSFEPAKGSWSLPGGFVKEKEDLDAAAGRVLRKLTGLSTVFLSQSHTYGETDRDSGARVISTAYYALIAIRDIDQELAKDNGAHWRSVSELPSLIFDHSDMVKRALTDLQYQIKVKPLGFELLPEKFTLVQLQELYEAIYQKKVDKRNFRKKILSMGVLEKLGEKEKETSKKGAWYYMFNKERYEKLNSNGFSFNLDVS
ncbi:MAG: DNA mismatch repair protein MutT [Bacteroidetes bacterium GWF2_41_9]|nr:MAG: DNA mismatch repair protein MutT [Bacteroidetes bacterium GWA2_40_15]OFX84802.1 MAG: DNA mismatch repair protein MutT [Bacteroidetes bacterium GWC2_40_22]OFY57696.1 MAG: DNA mismatch repair protein MutT [Bacteroidetes bacterium GWF2_41_9]HBH83379.1 DNA mismatch repair protein MutT [Bacteroidales bacterium]HBQ81680.1 DNA mismatch repair protein MutT [Bacteroidales bacterium]